MKNKQGFFLLVLGLFLFFVNGDNYAASALLIRMSTDFGTNISSAALTVVSYMLCFGLFTIFFGPLGDRYGKTWILKIATFGSAAASLLSAVSPNLSAAIIFRAINGIFSSGVMPVTVAFIGEISSPETRHPRIAKAMGWMFLGSALATVIGGSISQYGSWRHVYLAYGVAESLLFIPLFFALPKSSAAKGPSPLLAPYRELISISGFVKTIGLLFFIGFSNLGVFSYLGQFIEERLDLNLILIGLVLSSYGLGALTAGRFAGKIRNKTGKLFFPMFGIAGGLGFVAFTFAEISTFFAVLGLFISGFSFICLQSSIIAAAQEMAPFKRGAVMSAASFTMVTSAAAGTFINGLIYKGNPALVLYLAAGAPALAGLLAKANIKD